MYDPTETTRRIMTAAINATAAALGDDFQAGLESTGEQTWDTASLSRDFDVLGFAAPFVIVRRKADGVKGSLTFSHNPRVYYGFQPA